MENLVISTVVSMLDNGEYWTLNDGSQRRITVLATTNDHDVLINTRYIELTVEKSTGVVKNLVSLDPTVSSEKDCLSLVKHLNGEIYIR